MLVACVNHVSVGAKQRYCAVAAIDEGIAVETGPSMMHEESFDDPMAAASLWNASTRRSDPYPHATLKHHFMLPSSYRIAHTLLIV